MRLFLSFASIAFVTTGCMPHVAVPSSAWPHPVEGGGTLTVVAAAPEANSNTAPRIGVFAEGVMPLSRHPEPDARTVVLFRAGAMPAVWPSGTLAYPTADFHAGLRRLLVDAGPLSLSGEIGGMPTLWGFAIGLDGYAALRASLRFGALELFGSAEAGAGALFEMTGIDLITHTSTLVGGGGGLAVRADRCRIALIAAMTRNAQDVTAPTRAPASVVFASPYVGLQISADAAPKK